MAVGYRSSSSTGNESQASSKAPAVPAGAAAGDVVLVVLERWGGNPAVTPAAGFTDWGTSYPSGDSASNIHIYWKRLTTGDAGSYTFSWTGSLWSHAYAICMTGVIATGVPIEAVNGWSGTAGSFGSTSVTTAAIPGLVWTCYNDSAGTHTPPTSYTEVVDTDCGSLAYRIGTATGTETASGGSVTSSSPATAVLIALKPAAGGSSVDVAGATSAAGAATGDSSVSRGLTASGLGSAAAAGTMTATRTIAAAVSSTTEATAALTRNSTLTAAATTAAVLAGDLTIAGQATVTGDSASAADLAGGLTVGRPLAAISTAAAVLGGALDRRPGLVTAYAATAALEGAVVTARAAVGAISASFDAAGGLTVARVYTGALAAAGDTAAAVDTAPLITRGGAAPSVRPGVTATQLTRASPSGVALVRTASSARGGT